jgi:hypothetical protein
VNTRFALYRPLDSDPMLPDTVTLAGSVGPALGETLSQPVVALAYSMELVQAAEPLLMPIVSVCAAGGAEELALNSSASALLVINGAAGAGVTL